MINSGLKKDISVIIKITNNCNIECIHCYNASKSKEVAFLSFDNIEKLFMFTIPNYDSVVFIWHGGEPLLFGRENFEKALFLQRKYNINNCVIKNLIQTNGILLDDTYIDFLTENHFKIGISFDGAFNEILREQTSDVEKALELMDKKGLKFGVLSTLCNQTISHLSEIYDYFNEREINWSFGAVFSAGRALEFDLGIDIEKYLFFLNELIVHYIFDLNGKVRVRALDEYLYLLFGKNRRGCSHSSCLFKWISIDPDGSIYPCGRYYPTSYRLGNINEVSSLHDVFESNGYQNLLAESINRRKACIELCEQYKYCQGGCNNQFIIDNGTSDYCVIFTQSLLCIKSILESLTSSDINKINPKLRSMINTFLIDKQSM
jgi:uncharacterized protein